MPATKIEVFQGPYRFLSNFHPLRVHVVCQHRLSYETVENAYQASKTLDGRDRREMQKMTPAKAKVAGQKVILRLDWEQVKIAVMLELLLQKFLWNENLRDLLLDTNDAELIESNHYGDRFWGVSNGRGENQFGKLLMHVRGMLQCD